MYAKIENGKVVEFPIYDIYQRFPNVSFPEDLSTATLPEGYVKVAEAAQQPDYDSNTQKLVQGAPEFVGGSWVCVYVVQPLSASELLETQERLRLNALAKREELLRENVDRMNPIRWETLTAEQKVIWATYRQDLLDITSQAGYPVNIVWPEPPKD